MTLKNNTVSFLASPTMNSPRLKPWASSGHNVICVSSLTPCPGGQALPYSRRIDESEISAWEKHLGCQLPPYKPSEPTTLVPGNYSERNLRSKQLWFCSQCLLPEESQTPLPKASVLHVTAPAIETLHFSQGLFSFSPSNCTWKPSFTGQISLFCLFLEAIFKRQGTWKQWWLPLGDRMVDDFFLQTFL